MSIQLLCDRHQAWHDMMYSQRRFTKQMKGYENLSYGKLLTSLNLDSLARKRMYHDILLVFKASNGFASSKSESFGLELSRAPTRRGGNRFNKEKPLNNAMFASFRCRAPKEWNTLPDICINSSNLSTFKTSFDKFFKPDFID